mmetsp:Transcript_1123/g.2280  ORF Transcript_1123/g.2280 Transcript_1123/m.2280 type:complete len:222 (+) Transcript_1123:25-690(+)
MRSLGLLAAYGALFGHVASVRHGEELAVDSAEFDLTLAVLPYLKKQTKFNDCWYACIQMLRSSMSCMTVKPVNATEARKSALSKILPSKLDFVGKPLDFLSIEGREIMELNGLEVVPEDPDLSQLETTLRLRGPLIVLGKHLGSWASEQMSKLTGAGHFRVLSGITNSGSVTGYTMLDPWDGKQHVYSGADLLAWAKTDTRHRLSTMFYAEEWYETRKKSC